MHDPLWVFGYGSLMWNPGFSVGESYRATLMGYHRSFCMRSIHHRGTETEPGLVLALDAHPTAHCEGLAFRVETGAEGPALSGLRERELISSAYLETTCPVTLESGREIEAVTYVIDRDHDQYCGALPLEEQAQIIFQAVGGRGPNTEYLFNTVTHLAEIGVHDDELQWIADRVRELAED